MNEPNEQDIYSQAEINKRIEQKVAERVGFVGDVVDEYLIELSGGAASGTEKGTMYSEALGMYIWNRYYDEGSQGLLPSWIRRWYDRNTKIFYG